MPIDTSALMSAFDAFASEWNARATSAADLRAEVQQLQADQKSAQDAIDALAAKFKTLVSTADGAVVSSPTPTPAATAPAASAPASAPAPSQPPAPSLSAASPSPSAPAAAAPAPNGVIAAALNSPSTPS